MSLFIMSHSPPNYHQSEALLDILHHLLSRRTAIVIVPRLSGIVAEAVIVVVNLVNALLQHRHDVVKGAKTIRIVVASGIGSIYRYHGIVSISCQ